VKRGKGADTGRRAGRAREGTAQGVAPLGFDRSWDRNGVQEERNSGQHGNEGAA
jgi:hypothetical protein